MALAAVFWDRDGTLIEDPGFISDPDQVKLLPGAAEALCRLADAGLENVIATNQSGIARGLLDEPTLERIHDRLREALAAGAASIDAIYYCPYLDGEEAAVEAYRRDSDLRKPKPGMLLQASLERNLDLAASWSIGDSVGDAQAGRDAGCRTILVAGDSYARSAAERQKEVDFVAASLGEAVDIVLKHTRTARGEQADHTDHETPAILREILTFLRMVDRRGQAEDFSLARLAGAIVQILALAALVYAFFGLIRNDDLGVQIIRLLYTLVLQLIAITFFMLSSRK